MEVIYASPSSNNLSGGNADSVATASSSGLMYSTRPVKVIPLQHPTLSESSNSSSSSSVINSVVSRWQGKVKRMTSVEWIEMFLPCYRWIRTYKWRENLQVDLMAGVTVGIMLVPQVVRFSVNVLDLIYLFS